MWYRRENGVLVGGPYNCNQDFVVELLDDTSAEVVAFLNPVVVKPVPVMTAVELGNALIAKGLLTPTDLAAVTK